MPELHARFSPSAANRRIHCPPSLLLEEQFEEGESVYAAEGTAGHAMAEHIIRKYLGQQTIRPTSGFYTDELLAAVDEYVSFVTGEIEDARRCCASPILLVEQRVDVSAYVEGCFGTADMVIITDKIVHIIDLKLGKGVEVHAEENPQLMIYGLGVLHMAEALYDIETVRLTIFQPRLNNSSTWDVSPDYLKKWGEEVLRPTGAKALIGAGEFAAGTWCRFCKARNQCRARAEHFLEMAKLEFRQPALLTDEEVAGVIARADELSKWAADVYAYAQDQAIAHGKRWPGYKVVEGRSARRYTSEEDVARAAAAAGYTDIYKKSLLGVCEMERLMGKERFSAILGKLVYKPQGKLTLVPDSDRREAVSFDTAKDDFQGGTVMSMNPNKVIIPCRFSYLHCWEPDSVNGGDPRYSVSAIIPKSDTRTVEKIRAAIENAKKESLSKWGGKIPPNLKLPLRDGDIERPDDEAYAGSWFLNANSRQAPEVVDRKVQRILDQSEVYSGCYGQISVTFYGFNTNGNRGIAAGLGNIQKLRDGEPLGGKANAAEEFETYDDDDFLS